MGIDESGSRLESGKPAFKNLDKVSKVHVEDPSQGGEDEGKKTKNMKLNSHRPELGNGRPGPLNFLKQVPLRQNQSIENQDEEAHVIQASSTRRLRKLQFGGLEPSEASESQPQNRHVIREVTEQENETPDIHLVRANPSTKLDIYDDMAKNEVRADFDIYQPPLNSAKGTEMELKMMQSNLRSFDGESAVFTDVERLQNREGQRKQPNIKIKDSIDIARPDEQPASNENIRNEEKAKSYKNGGQLLRDQDGKDDQPSHEKRQEDSSEMESINVEVRTKKPKSREQMFKEIQKEIAQ